MNRKVVVLLVLAACIPGLLIGGAAVLSLTMLAGTAVATGSGVPAGCAVTLPGSTDPSGLSSNPNVRSRQIQNASTIMTVGQQLHVPPRGWAVAIATASQESHLLSLASMANPASLDYPHDDVALGDHDSVGIFQQRDAWGSMAERMNVAASAKLFFTGGHAGQRGLLDVPGWQNMPITVAAQNVQGSAFPSAYAQWEGLATSLVSSVGKVDVASACSGADIAPGNWTWPVHQPYTLTASFGEVSGHWATFHTGQDFAVPSGTPVHAVSSGVVKYVGWGGPYGNLTEIQHAGGVQSWYAHQTSSSVHIGQHVTTDEVIGLSGATGNVTGPHVHLEIRINDRPIDPMPFLHEHMAQNASTSQQS